MKEEPRQVFLTQQQWDTLPADELDTSSVYNVIEHNENGEITRTIARYTWDADAESMAVIPSEGD